MVHTQNVEVPFCSFSVDRDINIISFTLGPIVKTGEAKPFNTLTEFIEGSVFAVDGSTLRNLTVVVDNEFNIKGIGNNTEGESIVTDFIGEFILDELTEGWKRISHFLEPRAKIMVFIILLALVVLSMSLVLNLISLFWIIYAYMTFNNLLIATVMYLMYKGYVIYT